MELKAIIKDQFIICGTTNRKTCDVEEFLLDDANDQYESNRTRLLQQLTDFAEKGFEAEHTYSKIVNREHGIWEIKAGKLRLLYFKGHHPNIIIGVGVHVKSSQKANRQEVQKAIDQKLIYLSAMRMGSVSIVEED